MGRKIPARKHFGVRDPLRQNADKLAAIKDKIDNPPEKKDFQKVSHSLARFIKLKEAAKADSKKNQKKLKSRRNNNEDRPENYKTSKSKHAGSRNDKDLPNIILGENEGKKAFMHRVNRITEQSLQEAKFEAKYGVEVIRNKNTGEIKLKKKPRNEIDELLKQNQIKARRGGKSNVPNIILKPEEKKKLVKEMVEKKRAAKTEAEPTVVEYKKDEFRFGEVVHEPPQLVTPRHGVKASTVPRPGKKSLLLHNVIEQHTTPTDEVKTAPQTTQNSNKKKKNSQNKQIGTLKGKRKDLSMAMRHMIDTEQNNVVQLYKQIKKNQRIETATKT